MTENAKTEVPYPVICGYGEFMVDVPGLFLKSKNEEDAKMWSEAFNAAYAAGRASRDGLRKALEKIDGELGRPEGLGIPAPVVNASMIARVALVEDENSGRPISIAIPRGCFNGGEVDTRISCCFWPTPTKCNGEGTDDGSKQVFNPTAINCPACDGDGVVWKKI